MTHQDIGYTSTPRVDVDTTIVNTPTDRVRWGPIIAGLFAAMSVLILLSVLGLAVGLSSVDAGDRPANFGIGAGIWGAISALIAFFIGGMLAARTSATRLGTGVLQGAMVWMVAIPLLLYGLAGGIGSAARAVGGAATAGAQAAGTAAADPQLRSDAKAATQEAGDAMKQKVDEVKQQVTPEKVEQVANTAGKTAWGTLLSLLLGLGAAAAGGFVGSRPTHSTDRRTVVPTV